MSFILSLKCFLFFQEGERNYHIFYQILSTVQADPAFAERMKLQDPELFDFTSKSGVIHIDGVSDEKDFEEFLVRTFY